MAASRSSSFAERANLARSARASQARSLSGMSMVSSVAPRPTAIAPYGFTASCMRMLWNSASASSPTRARSAGERRRDRRARRAPPARRRPRAQRAGSRARAPDAPSPRLRARARRSGAAGRRRRSRRGRAPAGTASSADRAARRRAPVAWNCCSVVSTPALVSSGPRQFRSSASRPLREAVGVARRR